MDIGVKEPVDYFFNRVSSLRGKKLFLFDMDGTIYEEDLVFAGTHQLLELIERIGGRYVFITNNSSRSVEDYVEKVNRLGIRAGKENFFTSSQATVLYLKENYPNAKVYCQGTESFVKELKEAGIDVAVGVEEKIDLVLVGFDTEMTGSKLRNTCQILQEREVEFIATNPDLRCPVSFGYIPDCGSICQMIKNTTGKSPIYIGKPEPTMVDIVRDRFGNTKEETVVIGDRLYTDIATGVNAGVTSVCVLTGETSPEDIIHSDIKPTYTFQSVYNIWTSLTCYYGFEGEY